MQVIINIILFFVPLVFSIIPNDFLGALAFAFFLLIFNDFFPEQAYILTMLPMICLILNCFCFGSIKKGRR